MAYTETVDELDEAIAEVERANQRLIDVYLKMLRSQRRGVQAELVRRTGMSREYFRLLAREHDIQGAAE